MFDSVLVQNRKLFNDVVAQNRKFVKWAGNCFCFVYAFPTGKYAEKENHGFGIKKIQDTVKKYEEVCRISYTDTEFRLSLMIPIA